MGGAQKDHVIFSSYGIEPDPLLTVSEWADNHRILSQKASAEPGRWRTSRTPFLKEIMDCLSATNQTEEIIFMKGAQIGGTECGNNWIGYIIDYCPGPTMIVQPTVETAKRNSKQRITPLIEECPRLGEKVKDPRSRDSGNTVLLKEFPGGLLVMTGANSGVGLRSLPARFLFFDEIDAYPGDVDGEGDPVALAEARARTFSKRKKLKVSTPTIEGRSRIESYYNGSDQRKYYVPCLHCGEYQVLVWSQVKWDTAEQDGKKVAVNTKYECFHCQGSIFNWQKTKMLEKGRWVAEKPDRAGKTAGFHLSSLYSPVGWVSWDELAQMWLDAQGNREKLKTFINTVLGETWKDKGEAPDWKRLYERRSTYKQNVLPDPVCFITAGVDIQKDRIEVEITGWARDKISYLIDYRIYMGDTSSMDGEPWVKLAELVHEVWKRDNINIPIKLMAVDSGYNTQTVYSWVRQFPINKVIAVKGSENLSVMVGHPRAVDVTTRGRTIRQGLKLFQIGVNIIKSETYGFLKLASPDEGVPPPHGFCYFPELSEEYFKQLCAEEMTIKIVKGYKKYEWQKIYDRNEGLDCRVYSRAAASVCGIDRFKTEHWDKLEKDTLAKNTCKNEKKLQNIQKKPKIKRRKSKFL
jgi:phage terminase large subunit GpA-like protein